MRLAFRLSFSYFRRRKLRALLTATSVIVAIAAIVAVRGLTGSIDFVAGQIAGLMGGRAQLEVKAPLAGMDQSLVEDVKSVQDVKDAVPFVQTLARLDVTDGFIAVMGIDPERDRDIRTYQLAEGRLPYMGEQGIALPRALTSKYGLAIGRPVALQGTTGMRSYTLTGILDDSGIAATNSGLIAFLPLDTAQSAFGLEGKVSYISVVVNDSADVDSIRQRLQDRLGPGLEVQSPEGRRSDLDRILMMVKLMYNVLAALCLFLALFVVYNTLGVAVAEQKQEIGILRSVGWRRRDVRLLILAEAGLIGAAGSLIALLTGKYLATALLSTVAGPLRDLAKIDIPSITLNPSDYIASWLIGVAACLVSAWLPARRATEVTPLSAIRQETLIMEEGYSRRRLLIGALLMVATLPVVRYAGHIPGSLFLAPAAFIGGSLLLLPPLLIWMLKRLQQAATGRLGLIGRLGLGNYRRLPRRTVITGLPIIFGLAISLSFATEATSITETTRNWMNELVVPDIIVNQGLQGFGINASPLPESMIDKVQKVDGVDVVVGVRMATIEWNGMTLDIDAGDDDAWRKFATPPIGGTDREQAFDVLASPGGMWVSDNLVAKTGQRIGDEMTLQTPTGPQTFRIGAIIREMAAPEGALFINRNDYRRYWRDSNIDYVDVTVKQGADPAVVRDNIDRALKRDYKVQVDQVQTFRDRTLTITKGFTDIVNLVVIVAFIVAAVGVANSLLIAVMQRTKEIGILRSAGMFRREVRRMFFFEVACLFAAALILAVPMAAGLYQLNVFEFNSLNGQTLDLYTPWSELAGIVLATAVIVSLSMLYPAARGARIDPVEAIRSE